MKINNVSLSFVGNRDYKISFLSSGEMIATTLAIHDFHEEFPRDFETVLTSIEGTMQYQIKTVITDSVIYKLENIDSPEWVAVPPPQMTFRKKHPMKVHCKVFVPNEKDGFQFTNELNMFRAFLEPDKRKPPKIHFEEVIGLCLFCIKCNNSIFILFCNVTEALIG